MGFVADLVAGGLVILLTILYVKLQRLRRHYLNCIKKLENDAYQFELLKAEYREQQEKLNQIIQVRSFYNSLQSQCAPDPTLRQEDLPPLDRSKLH